MQKKPPNFILDSFLFDIYLYFKYKTYMLSIFDTWTSGTYTYKNDKNS
jgi:hypothetical protein